MWTRNINRHPGESRDPYDRKYGFHGSRIARLRRLSGMTILFLLAAITTSNAAEEAAAPVIYSPPPCEFSVTFPGEPYKTQQCEDESKKDTCFEKISYTQVYQLSSTVNFRVICNPIGEDVIETYSGSVMEKTLQAMTKDSVVQTYETSFREEKDYKQAGLVGEGKVGRLPTIYIAQLWIGKKSALSVEAEMIGEADDKADTLFSEVLRSIHYAVNDKQEEPEKVEAKQEIKEKSK